MKRHQFVIAAVASTGMLLSASASAATGFSGQADGTAPHATDRSTTSRALSGSALGGTLRSADGWVFMGEAGWVFDGRGMPNAVSKAAFESRQQARPTANRGALEWGVDGIYVGA